MKLLCPGRYPFLSLALILLFSLAGSPVYGQYKITGTITGSDKIPVATATVALFTAADSLLSKIVLTEDNGSFAIDNLKSAGYYLRITHINYYDTLIGISSASLSQSGLVAITLRSKAKGIGGVVVTAAKPLIERKTDRTVFNVENSISATGGDALDALQKAPRVIVNDDNISITGKSGVKIMLNDRMMELSGDDLMEFLKSISADDISRIEIITSPPAGYDAEGNSGIINIVLKKSSRKGVNGNLRGGFGANTYAYGTAGGSLNYANDRLSLYSTFHAERGADDPSENMEIFYPAQHWTKYNTRKVEIADVNGTAGADYKLTKKTTIGFMYNGNYSAPGFNGHIVNPIYSTGGVPDSSTNTHTHTVQHNTSQSVNLDLQYLPGKSGKKLTIDADYFTSSSTKDRLVLNSTSYPDTTKFPVAHDAKSYSDQQINVYTAKADLKLPYKALTINTGGKISFIENNTPASYYNIVNNILVPDPGNTDHFIYRENTQALYLDGSRELAKWSFQAGLRGEFTQTEGQSKTDSQTNRNHYFKLFPTVFVTWKENDDHNWSFTYGRRINRPEYWRTNPFKFYSTPYFYQAGNPFLQPSYSNNAELVHSWKNTLTSTLFFHNTNDEVEQITIISDTSNIISNNYKNYLTVYTFGITELLTLNQWKWLESNSTLTLYQTDVYSRYPGTPQHTQSLSANFNTDNTIILNKAKTVMAELSLTYQFPETEGIQQYDTHSNLDIGMKLTTRNKKWVAAINATDILRTEIYRYHTTFNGIYMRNYGYYDNRGFRINITCKFGKSKTDISTHAAGNEDETRRAR